jgi:5'-nucleotidase/UDP-sugar diphosphatase
MADLKRLVLLHSNDMHGDFLSKVKDEKLIGGVSMLSGYVSKVREEEESVLYTIAGDMLQGSLIDTEFKGISTMEIMNHIAPDIVCIGNHEVDYGLPHLLFLEKFAKFPIITANLYIKNQLTRLLAPSRILELDGLRVLFIGILTDAVLDSIRTDKYIGSFVDIKDASIEVGKICNAYRTTDVDLTVLLTHIGFDNDCALAALLDPEWGVDLIIGGHSHTILERPAEVNGIKIAQAGTGTVQIGRFDLEIDKESNHISSYSWTLVPIDPEHCPRDEALENLIGSYENRLGEKYGRILTHFSRRLTHPERTQETELGDLFADICAKLLGVDLMLLGSGSIRKTELGPTVTLADLYAIFPFPESILQVLMSGAQIRRAFEKILLPLNLTNSSEHYQVNRGVEVIYDERAAQVVSLRIHGDPIKPDALYKVGIQNYHFNSMEKFLGLKPEDVLANGKQTLLATSQTDLIEEYLMTHNNLKSKVEGRIQRVVR